MSFSRFALVLALLALPVGLTGCGGEADAKDAADSAARATTTPMTDEARKRLDGAGRNVQELYGVLSWIDDAVDGAGKDEAESLRGVMREGLSRFSTACNEIVRSVGDSQDVAKMDTFEDWMTATIATEAARPDADERGIRSVLDQHLVTLRTFMLAYRRNDEELRNALGYTKLDIDFEALAEAPYLDTNEIKRIERIARDVKADAETVDGITWVKNDGKRSEELAKVLLDLEQREAAHRERMKDPWEQKALGMFEEITGQLVKDLNASYEWVARTHRPYLLIIEKDAGWNETQVALKRAEALLQLHEIFYESYGSVVELREIEDPIPVVYFNKARAYNDYASKRGVKGALGHFEPATGRLFTSKDTDMGTVFHEGTHQLSFFNSQSGPFFNHSYWFEEGLAEFLAANELVKKADEAGFEYEIGLLQKGRLEYWRQNEGKAYSLWDLLSLTYAAREINTMNGDEDKNLMVYSQGWFLCYFMNHFAVDETGTFLYGRPGKYQQAWLKFFGDNIRGKCSREDFLAALGMKDATADDPRFRAFEREFLAFYEWMNRKIAGEQFKGNKLLPWDQCISTRGKLFGEKEDDVVLRDDAK